MKVKYIKDESMHLFRNSAKQIQEYLAKYNDRSWVQKLLGSNAFGETKIDVKDLEFIIDNNVEPIETDFENAKMLYETFKRLNETQATDERFWIGLELNEGYDYMMYRWGIDDSTRFKYRWNFFTKGKRGLLYHGLSRLWWYAKYTYDPNREDPYELTKYGFKNQSIIAKMFYRNYANNLNVVIAILSAMKRFEEEGNTLILETANKLYKEVSLLSSVSIIDAYSKEELEERIYQKLIIIVSLEME